jgi:hypothetical protein
MSHNTRLWLDRGKELLAMCMIGDGVLAVIDPRRHVRLWERGPEVWERTMRPFAQRPTLTRLIGLAEAAVGVWLGRRQRSH